MRLVVCFIGLVVLFDYYMQIMSSIQFFNPRLCVGGRGVIVVGLCVCVFVGLLRRKGGKMGERGEAKTQKKTSSLPLTPQEQSTGCHGLENQGWWVKHL